MWTGSDSGWSRLFCSQQLPLGFPAGSKKGECPIGHSPFFWFHTPLELDRPFEEEIGSPEIEVCRSSRSIILNIDDQRSVTDTDQYS